LEEAKTARKDDVTPPRTASPIVTPPRPAAERATKELRIGIDARAAVEVPARRGRLVRELLRALAAREDGGERYLLYARKPWWEEPLDARFQWRTIPARDPWWHVRTARRADRECDVFLSTNSYLTALLTNIPTVPIVYDLAPFEPAMRPNRRSVMIERLTLGRAVRRSAGLLAISDATAAALTERFPAAAGRTSVALLGVPSALAARPGPGDAAAGRSGAAAMDSEETERSDEGKAAASAPAGPAPLDPAEAASLPAPGFVLAVGTLEPRKNLPRLVEAYASLGAEATAGRQLVVVGPKGWQTGQTDGALRSLGERCTALGHVYDAALAELYRRCAVFCYPSLGEGFGLPVLEAMAAGAAVLTSNLSSLPEVGGDAVEYVDPHDAASIAAGLKRLLGDEARRAELGRMARERANRFTWERFAGEVLRALGEAAGSG
jgi:glycosyltransferase involved in cell wall biosynthesis